MIRIDAKKVVILDGCRAAHGDAGAIDEALRYVRDELATLLAKWPTGEDTRFHIVVSLERERKEIPDA